MFTKDQLSALLHANGKEGIMATVNQIPEDELRNALVLAVTMYQQQASIYEDFLFARFAWIDQLTDLAIQSISTYCASLSKRRKDLDCLNKCRRCGEFSILRMSFRIWFRSKDHRTGRCCRKDAATYPFCCCVILKRRR